LDHQFVFLKKVLSAPVWGQLRLKIKRPVNISFFLLERDAKLGILYLLDIFNIRDQSIGQNI